MADTIGGGRRRSTHYFGFAPAAEVEIKLRGTDGNDVSVFKGVVTGLTVHTRDGVPTLEAVIKDKAVCLAGARHS